MNELGKNSLVGRTLAHYRISTVIGAGGMGEVYRATDTKLAREIALKVLPPDMASDPDRLARFQREARAVAALNHPNVVTVYSVEHSENIHFITMELIEGQPLDRLISANGLAADRIIEIASAVAEALAAAHEKGIVHRDLKPANVMVTNDGRVKVLDFGLAKDVGAETANDKTLTSTGRTQAGMIMGTPAYMSPEQVSGRPLDYRSDIFSFGVLLHEMATGCRPFEGASSAELISSILRDSPPSVADARPELPSDIARVIRRCLEKDPRHRMQTARDVSNEFRDLARTSMPLTPVSTSSVRARGAADSGATGADESFWVAVLPLKYTGGNADLKALAEGFSEEIITGLSRFSYLRVVAHGSTAKYLSDSGEVGAIGKELGARYVMEGSIRQAGSKLRLAIKLVEAATGAHLWAETYERGFPADAVFELQDDLVPRIVSTVADMNGALPRSMSERLRTRPPEQLSPYQAVLRSFFYCTQGTPEELTAARSALEMAVKKAPTHSDAWAMLAFLHCQDYVHGFNLRADALAAGAEAGRRAVEAGPSNHLAHFSLAQALFMQKEYHAFRNAAERTVALNNMDGNSIAFIGEMLTYAGDEDRGMALAERAKQLNPNHPGWYWYADFYRAYRHGDYRGALGFALKSNMPSHYALYLLLAAAYGQLGEQDNATKALQELLRMRPDIASIARFQTEKVWNPEYGERFLEGLRKAGLDIPDADSKSTAWGAYPANTASGGRRADEGFWVAVLPFKFVGNADLSALAEGLTDDVVTGLSRFSYLRVVARGSSARYAKEATDVRAAAAQLGARYVMEGNIRQAGAKVRIAAQLVDASYGVSLWAETYDRPFTQEATLDLLDELVPRIVSTIADQHGILQRSISAAIRKKTDDQLTPYEAVFRVFSLHEKMTAPGHAACRDLLERIVRDAPDAADCWAMLATLYSDEDWFGFNLRPDPLGRAAEAAQRAAELAPASALASQALAQSLFMRREWQAFRPVAERTIALNPMDGAIVALMGILLACSGDWERGCTVADSAMKLHPNFPGWYRLAKAFDAYRTRDYRGAIDVALRIQMPGYFWTSVVLAAAHGQVGDREAAQKALKELLVSKPEFATRAQQELEKWFESELVDHYMQGLRDAGLECVDGGHSSASKSGITAVRTSSGETRADEGFWVAVLPFKYAGSNPDLKALAEGLSEEVITGLSRFSYLRVIARGSSAKYSSESEDVRTIGKELGARYVMEGSLRHAGSKLRLAVHLVETISGAHLWAETYERNFNADAVFELQDDLVPRIVSTVADMNGALPRSMSAAVRGGSSEQLTPYEAVLRSFGYFEGYAPENLAQARAGLEAAVKKAPSYGDAWAMLALLHVQDYAHSFDLQPDALASGAAAARRAVEVAPSNHLAYFALAQAHFFQKELPSFRNAAERTIAMNPMDGNAVALLGELFVHSGDAERGMKLAGRAKRLNPNHPGWYWHADFNHAYRRRDYRGAVEAALKCNLPGYFGTQALLAAGYAQLGDAEEASKALRELMKLRPNVASTIRRDVAKWFDPDHEAHLLDGLRKAGLEIPEKAK